MLQTPKLRPDTVGIVEQVARGLRAVMRVTEHRTHNGQRRSLQMQIRRAGAPKVPLIETRLMQSVFPRLQSGVYPARPSGHQWALAATAHQHSHIMRQVCAELHPPRVAAVLRFGDVDAGDVEVAVALDQDAAQLGGAHGPQRQQPDQGEILAPGLQMLGVLLNATEDALEVLVVEPRRRHVAPCEGRTHLSLGVRRAVGESRSDEHGANDGQVLAANRGRGVPGSLRTQDQIAHEIELDFLGAGPGRAQVEHRAARVQDHPAHACGGEAVPQTVLCELDNAGGEQPNRQLRIRHRAAVSSGGKVEGPGKNMMVHVPGPTSPARRLGIYLLAGSSDSKRASGGYRPSSCPIGKPGETMMVDLTGFPMRISGVFDPREWVSNASAVCPNVRRSRARRNFWHSGGAA